MVNYTLHDCHLVGSCHTSIKFVLEVRLVYNSFSEGGPQMSRIRINFLHHRTPNKCHLFKAENRLLSKSTDGFANTWPRSYVQVTLDMFVRIDQ